MHVRKGNNYFESHILNSVKYNRNYYFAFDSHHVSNATHVMFQMRPILFTSCSHIRDIQHARNSFQCKNNIRLQSTSSELPEKNTH